MLNPEQLLMMAAASCQLLSFLAVAARAGVDVLGYRDHATAEMPENQEPIRIVSIQLKPEIVVASGTDVDRVLQLVHQAHAECYIANSLKTEVGVDATIHVQP